MSAPAGTRAESRDIIAEAVHAALLRLAARRSLPLAAARRLARLAEGAATALGVPVVVAVADAEGGLVLVHRMDGALPASTDIAVGKAYTAAAFRMATHELGALARPDGPLCGVEATNHGRVVLFGGGYPCRRGGATVGALGISGGTVEQDMQIASDALLLFQDEPGSGPGEGDDHE